MYADNQVRGRAFQSLGFRGWIGGALSQGFDVEEGEVRTICLS